MDIAYGRKIPAVPNTISKIPVIKVYGPNLARTFCSTGNMSNIFSWFEELGVAQLE